MSTNPKPLELTEAERAAIFEHAADYSRMLPIVTRIKAAARREALLEAKTLAAGRYSAWLPSPGLSSDWVAGWHAANNDITTTLQVATERDEEGGR